MPIAASMPTATAGDLATGDAVALVPPRAEPMQVLVIGAGVVGLAIARAAALAGHDVIVAEAEATSAAAPLRATAR